jgi:hypothetical protein
MAITQTLCTHLWCTADGEIAEAAAAAAEQWFGESSSVDRAGQDSV